MRYCLLLLLVILSFSELQARKKKRKKSRRAHPAFKLKNVPLVSGAGPELSGFLRRMNRIMASGTGESILIIGDSHQQCEDFGTSLARYLRDSAGIPSSGRNYVFPYPMARTSHRSKEQFRFQKSDWKGCRVTSLSSNCSWGIPGWLAESDADSLRFSWSAEYPFVEGDEIGILAPAGQANYRLFREDSTGKVEILYNAEKCGYFFRLDHPSGNLAFKALRNGSALPFAHQGFVRKPSGYGLSLGIAGANGARLDHYLLHPDFHRHLRVLNPGLVLVALGTNDAFLHPFDPNLIRRNLGMLVSRIKMAQPGAAIVLIGPPDHCRRRGRINPNTQKVNRIFAEMAEELELGFWNLQEAMGGEGSAYAWRHKKLITNDLVHFTVDGYGLQGRMLGKALIQSMPAIKP